MVTPTFLLIDCTTKKPEKEESVAVVLRGMQDGWLDGQAKDEIMMETALRDFSNYSCPGGALGVFFSHSIPLLHLCCLQHLFDSLLHCTEVPNEGLGVFDIRTSLL